jgi:anthranilate phosphoribosyltransferase
MIDPVIQTMKEMGFQKAVVFHGTTGNGSGGIDELSPVGKSYVAELDSGGHITHYTIDPNTVGLKYPASLKDIAAGEDPREEALRLLRVLSGAETGPLYETVCLNAAPVLYVAGETDSLKEGIEKSRTIIDSGQALDKLEQWVITQNRNPRKGEEKFTSLLHMV